MNRSVREEGALRRGRTLSRAGHDWQPSERELTRRAYRRRAALKYGLISALSSLVVLGTLIGVLVTSPGFKTLSDTFFNWAYGAEVLPKILLGFMTNVVLTIIAASCVAVLGLQSRYYVRRALRHLRRFAFSRQSTLTSFAGYR
jgi:polar amino acid transport system permease protein